VSTRTAAGPADLAFTISGPCAALTATAAAKYDNFN
jgi:hypothetical protein